MLQLPVLTSVAVVVGVHEGEPQALVLLQRALVSEAPVNGTHHVCLLVAVVNGGFGHVDGFSAGCKGEEGGRSTPSAGLTPWCYEIPPKAIELFQGAGWIIPTTLWYSGAPGWLQPHKEHPSLSAATPTPHPQHPLPSIT